MEACVASAIAYIVESANAGTMPDMVARITTNQVANLKLLISRAGGDLAAVTRTMSCHMVSTG